MIFFDTFFFFELIVHPALQLADTIGNLDPLIKRSVIV